MPKIPGSSGRQLSVAAPMMQGTNMPMVPQDLATGGAPGGGRAGSGFAGLADVIKSFDEARRENDLQTGKVQYAAKGRDLRANAEEKLDAEGVQGTWDEGVKSMRDEIVERYKNDEQVQNKLLNFVDNFASEQGVHVRGTARKRVVDLAKADGMANDETLLSTLTKASSLRDFEWAQQLHDEDVESKLGTGVYSAVEAQERKHIFNSLVQKRRETFTEEQRLNGVYSTLYKTFGKNPNAAVQYVQNPDNWENLGIGYKEALHFIGEFDKQASRDKRRSDEAREAGARAEMTAYWKAVDKGDLDEAGRVLSRARNIGGRELVGMKQALKKDQWDDDPKVVADVQRRIWSGEITDVGELAPLMGNGLSPKTARTMREDVEKIAKEAPEFPGAMNFYSNALNRYKVTFKDTPMAEHEGKFAATLTYQARLKKIGPFDPRMDTLADEILQVVEKPWFSKDKTRFEQQFEAKSLPGVPSDTGTPMPAPRPVPAAQAKPSSIQQIPRAEYDLVKQALAQAGRDTSDDTVLSVWLANRSKFKGAQ